MKIKNIRKNTINIEGKSVAPDEIVEIKNNNEAKTLLINKYVEEIK